MGPLTQHHEIKPYLSLRKGGEDITSSAFPSREDSHSRLALVRSILVPLSRREKTGWRVVHGMLKKARL